MKDALSSGPDSDLDGVPAVPVAREIVDDGGDGTTNSVIGGVRPFARGLCSRGNNGVRGLNLLEE